MKEGESYYWCTLLVLGILGGVGGIIFFAC